MGQRSLFWHLFPLHCGVLLLAFGVATLLAVRAVRAFHVEQTGIRLEAVAALAAGHFESDAILSDPAAVHALCAEIGRRSATRYTVILPCGRVIGDSEEPFETMDNHADRPEIARALAGETGRSTRYSPTLRRRMMYVAVPLRVAGETAGVLRSALAVSTVGQTVTALQKRLAAIVVSILLLAFGVSLFASRRVARPIADLQRAAERLARRHFDFRLPSPHCREVEGLADSIDRLARDLHERLREATQQRVERDAIFAAMRECVLALDRSGRLVFANPAAQRLFDFDAHAAAGQSLRTLVRNAQLFSLVDEALAGAATAERDIAFHAGAETIFRVHVSPLNDGAGRPDGVLLVLEDVTHMRRLEKVRQDFVTNVSHELKTPITSIAGFVETLLDGALERPPEARRFLEIIGRQARGLGAIVDDLLALSRLEDPEARKTLQFREQAVADLLRSAAEPCAERARAGGVALDIRCDDGLTARLHPGLMEQALTNLILNAVTYSSSGSTVRIFAQRREDRLDLGVQDHGCGIARHHLGRIFERFYRIDRGRSRNGGGTGLGLSIVKHIATLHGAEIDVASVPGKGSTFTIVLPAPQASSGQGAGCPPAGRPPGGRCSRQR